MTRDEIAKCGTPALRFVLRFMNKRNRLTRRLTGTEVSALRLEEAADLVFNAQEAGFHEGKLRGLCIWAVKKAGTGTAPAAKGSSDEMRAEMDASDDGDEAEPEAPAAPAQQPEAPASSDDAGALLQQAVALISAATARKPSVDVDAVRRIVRDEIDAAKLPRPMVVTVELRAPDGQVKKIERAHKSLPLLIKALAAKRSVFMVGPAGSGKTHGAAQAAEALGIPFHFNSWCNQSTLTQITGFIDAQGTYHATEFRKAYEFGGVYLADEIDNGNANIVAFFNAALSNGQCAFPDKTIPKHASFRFVAAGNTWGHGKTAEYIGRNALDAATLNRFVRLPWAYDEGLELELASNKSWCHFVQDFRRKIAERGIKVVISPRQTLDGCALIEQGVPLETVVEMTLTAEMDPAKAEEVIKAIGKDRVRAA